MKRVAARYFYQFRQLWSIRPALSADNARMLVHALISNRVDYCNSNPCNAAASHLRPLQSVLNAAARLVVKKRKYDSITSTLRDDLHWLQCLCVNELTTNCVSSSTNACTSWLRRTCHQWLFLYWQLQHVAICVPQAKVICWCQWPKLCASALEALQLRAHRHGTVCQRLWRTRCWQLGNSATS